MTIAADQLRRVPLFAGMTDRAFEAVAALAREDRMPAGSVLAVEGAPGESFYLLLEGQVEITRAGEPVARLGAGEFLGEIALVDGRPRTATAVAASDVRAAVIDRAAFSELMERFAAVRNGILVALADRIRADEGAAVD
jgi:CRP-like cAMP-binding protein